MARHPTIPDEQILEAARAVFLEEGFGAGTAEIARRAGVSEGLLFKRYETKEKLFLASMMCAAPAWHADLERLSGVGDLRENLVTVCLGMVSFFEEILPRVTMHWANKVRDHSFLHAEPPPVRDIKLLAAFLEQEIKLGRLRPCDPEVLARTLFGAIHSHVIMGMFGVNRRLPIASATYVRGLVAIVWEGAGP
jgi:AcrR family transcriptional regulator